MAADIAKKIFVSYRRDDDGAYLVPELNRKLTSRYGEGSVFYDIDNIPLGVDFREFLSNAIATASIVLVVIGDRWAGNDAQTGLRRIDRDDDFVRIEVESALIRGIPVVPVLVGKAAMPCEKELPASIAQLAYRNAAEVRTGRDYDLHIDKLLSGLDPIMVRPPQVLPADVPVPSGTSSQPKEAGAELGADRGEYPWNAKSTPAIRTVVESIARAMISARPGLKLSWNSTYLKIAPESEPRNTNFCIWPQKSACLVEVRLPDTGEYASTLSATGAELLPYGKQHGRQRITIKPAAADSLERVLVSLANEIFGCPTSKGASDE